MTDLLVSRGDSFFYINGQMHTIDEYLASVDEVLDNVRKHQDFTYGFTAIRSMTATGQAIGISLAKLLDGLETIWNEAQIDGDFYEFAKEYTPVTRITVKRYINAWKGIQKAPPELQEDFMTRPMKDLYRVGAAIQQGYEIEDETWEKLLDAPNNTEFSTIIREDVTGKPPKKNGMSIYLDEDTGELEVWYDNNVISLGYLNTDQANNPVIAKAINRIVEKSHIILR